MEFLPQELVYAIVQGIDETPSLKSCALAGSIFRDAAQRLLLRSLTLKGDDVQPAYVFLDESPHIASYITRLRMTLERAHSEDDSQRQSLQQILSKLVNVRQCVLSFYFSHIPTFLFEFLERQPLRELNIDPTYGLSPASILRLLTVAPVVSFTDLFTDREDPGLSLDIPRSTPRVEELIFEDADAECFELLAHPQLKLATTLRRLSILDACYAWPAVHGPKFISIAAPTLEYLHLGGLTHLIILPAFPSLRSVEFKLWIGSTWCSWLSDIISPVIRTSPLLAAVIISFSPITFANFSFAPGAALIALDAALAAHPGHAGIQWRFAFRSRSVDESARARIFAALTTSIQAGMPQTHEQARLVVERIL